MKQQIISALTEDFHKTIGELRDLVPSESRDRGDVLLYKLMQYQCTLHDTLTRLGHLKILLVHAESDLNHHLSQINRIEGKE